MGIAECKNWNLHGYNEYPQDLSEYKHKYKHKYNIYSYDKFRL